jgi:hypothetical protein
MASKPGVTFLLIVAMSLPGVLWAQIKVPASLPLLPVAEAPARENRLDLKGVALGIRLPVFQQETSRFVSGKDFAPFCRGSIVGMSIGAGETVCLPYFPYELLERGASSLLTLPTVAGVPTIGRERPFLGYGLTYRFVPWGGPTPRLWQIEARISHDDFSTLQIALGEKYGVAISAKKVPIRTLSGAEAAGRVEEWRRGQDTVTLSEYDGDLRISVMKITAEDGASEAARLALAAAKRAADDL